MENTHNQTASPQAATVHKPRKRSVLSKAFWGLIGLVVVVSVGLISMAVVSMNKYTHEAPKVANASEPEVEIISLGGNNHVVAGNMVPANPAGVDESVVVTGTASAVQNNAGAALVEQVAVKPVTPVKKQAAVVDASAELDKPVKTPKVKADKAVTIQKEANKQMDNLF